MALVECIPNFSEGRRRAVIDALVGAVTAVPGVALLDVHSDPDHNRSVLTLAGEPQPVLEAVYAAIARAAELIDLDSQRGQHPRIGAADVVPFVPLEGLMLQDCVGFANQLGERVGRELGIPVYLYEAAATRPARVNLAEVRRGEYEGLKTAIETDLERAPDYGPSHLGKAGAVAIGARLPLIAYNVYLNTDDVEIARKIAESIRYSGGGLAHVKALGLLVVGRAQVSMNLTDYTRTPLPRVMEMIRSEAARYGVAVQSAELVGLIPQAALIEAARWYLQLDGFEPDQILEDRLRSRLNPPPQ
jgi:glutamate formiminotransferase